MAEKSLCAELEPLFCKILTRPASKGLLSFSRPIHHFQHPIVVKKPLMTCVLLSQPCLSLLAHALLGRHRFPFSLFSSHAAFSSQFTSLLSMSLGYKQTREESQDKYLFRDGIKAAPSRKNKKNWHHFITNISLGVWMGCCTLFSVWRHYPRPPSFFLCHILSKASKTERKRGSWILNALI